jgi:hypothetical protein
VPLASDDGALTMDKSGVTVRMALLIAVIAFVAGIVAGVIGRALNLF